MHEKRPFSTFKSLQDGHVELAGGVLVGPAEGLWGLWCRSVGPVVEAFSKSQLNKENKIGQISP
jgi:hypothetical protein